MRCSAVRMLVVGAAVAIGPLQSAESQMLVEAVASNHQAYVPSGTGRFPTVVAIPGCSGVSLNGPATDAGRPGREGDRLFRRHYPRMAERLREHGYAAILVDYLTAEGVANTCGREISHERVGEYIQASVTFALQQPFTDPDRLFVIGWSHGGGGLLAWFASARLGPTHGCRGCRDLSRVRYPWSMENSHPRPSAAGYGGRYLASGTMRSDRRGAPPAGEPPYRALRGWSPRLRSD